MNTFDLSSWGWNPGWALAWTEARPHLPETSVPARVVGREGPTLRLRTAGGPRDGILAGRLQYHSTESELPLVGDWVAAQEVDATQAVVHFVLPRRSTLGRLEGLIAANLDELVIVMGLDGNFNLRRAFRLATLARAGGIQPVLVLSKADLPGVAPKIAKARERAAGTPLVVLSSRTGLGLAALKERWREGQTIGLAGSSGVGKTTLVNRLLGWELPTADVGSDSKGRHTTTSRQLYRLPSGALLMDMPGVRAVGLWGSVEDLNEEFTDIAAVARLCRFSNCRHEYEPGCEVRAALESGELDEGRWVAYRKQERELRYLERRDDPVLQRAERDQWRAIHQQNRRFSKEARSRGI